MKIAKMNFSGCNPSYQLVQFVGSLVAYVLAYLAGRLIINEVYISFIHSFIKGSIAPSLGPWPLFQFRNPIHTQTQSVGLLRRRISLPQGRYLHTRQHKHRISSQRHPCLEWGSNPHDPSDGASEGVYFFLILMVGGGVKAGSTRHVGH
jgi:hypothetical protein